MSDNFKTNCMKRIIYILLFSLCSMNAMAQFNNCCPEFSLRQLNNIMPCQGDSTCKEGGGAAGNPSGGASVESITACKNSVQSYYVFPNLPGFTFNWTIVGGTPTSFSGNPAVITWGNGSSGFLQVIISDSTGNCRDTITKKVCLLNSPIAAFTISPNDTICTNQYITFNNTSLGASTYSWNFGDGTYSNLQNPPPHQYTLPGTYTVLLTVSNSSGGTSPGQESRCGCTDTATAVITVLSGTAPTITASCKQMLCPKDTATYCVSPGCAPYNWTVNGGVIIQNNGSCITVQWNATAPSTMPASVSVTTGCGGPCGNAATLAVPVLWNNLPINGEDTVCVGSTTTYTLPTMPGTFYTWSVSGGGGGTITGPNQNTSSISINWAGPPGNAIITCSYTNPYSGCSGTTTLAVKVRRVFLASGPASVCAASTAVYTIGGGGPGNWIISPATGYTISGSSTNTNTLTVNWTTAGTYTITAVPTTATAGNYCNLNSTITVVVKPKPVLNNIVGPTSVCPGSYYTYSVSSSMTGPFVWSTSANGTIISSMGANNDSVIVQWNLTGPHTLSVSQTINGCTGTKQLTPINNIPPVTITGTSAVCRDQNPYPTYIASGGLPAGSYTWSITPAAAGTIMSGTGTNTISVLWHGATSPGTSSATVSVVICNYTPVNFPVTITTPPNVTVSKTGSLCTPAGVTLTVSPSLPCYQWYLNGVLIPGATSATYNTVTYNTGYGYYEVKCPTQCSGFGGIFIPREHIPNVSITANNKLSWCTTETINLTLFSAAGGGCTYQWFKNNVALGAPSGVNTSLPVNSTGSYYQVVSCGSCKDTSNTLTVYTIQCDAGPGCDFSFMPSPVLHNNNIGKAGPAAPSTDIAPYTATLNIGTPTNLCNNPQFSAVYSFTAPHSFNSGINWDFGDGNTFGTTTSGGFTPAHSYTSLGTYVVKASVQVNCPPPPTPHICTLIDTIHYTVKIAANFNYSVNCNKIYLNDMSAAISGCSIASYAWSATGPGSVSFSSPTAPSPILTVGASGTYNVTLTVTSTCSGCTSTLTVPVVVNVPTASFTAPSPVCAGTPIAFNAPPGFSNYYWNFGDGYTSSTQNTTHAFGLTPTNPNIILTVTNAFGCVAKDTVAINVIPPPPLSITPLQLICPGTTATITATGAGFSTYDFYHNGVLVQSGASNTYTTGAIGTYYVIANTSSGGCAVRSVNTYVFNKPNPVADIQGSSVACLISGNAYVYLYNAVNDPNTTYVWTLQGNNTPLSNVYDLNLTLNATGNYSYVLTATGANGCIARDTFCVVVGESPAVTVTTSTPGTMCAGVSHTFTANATPPNPNYIYQWSNGMTGPVMSTSLPGMYMVMVTNPANGCIGSAFAGIIQPRPSTVLFPVGCDTLCSTDSIIPPLALGGPIVPNNYIVQWFLNGNYGSPFYTGPVLNLPGSMPPLVFGMNNISIVVTYNGCSDTSNAYNLFIKNCDSCDCKGSSWGEIVGQPGNPDPAKVKSQNSKIKIAVTGNMTPMLCKKNYTIPCNQPYTIYASYNCKDTACAGKVTYSLQPPSGSPITGNAPVTFTPTVSGVYILTLYGWCGDKLCDSCVIDLTVKCDPLCDCKGSKWNGITLTQQQNSPPPTEAKAVVGNNAVINPVKLNCGKTYDVKCKASYSVNAGYTCVGTNCPGSVQYIFTGPTGTTTGNTMPFNFSLTVTGTYTLTLYGYCGTTKCDSCIVSFKVDCPKDTTCCPYNINVSNPTTTLTTLSSPPATIANSTFTITGPPGNLFTEIRAEVVDYVLSSNYKNECLSCKTYPYAWGSMYQPGNAGAIPPKITMYNSTVPAFNPSGNGMYQNPREVVWTSTTPFTLPSSLNLSFLLPPASIIDCCELTAKICVKFTFRDKDCKECEVIVCYTVIIKPGGGPHDDKACNCSIKPVLKWEGGSKTLACGETIDLFSGNIPVTLQPNFECKDANGKDCKSGPVTVTIKKPNNTVQTLTGPNYNFTYSLALTGTFEYTISGTCDGKKCECKFYVVTTK
jgi:PKD repeat protein